MSVELYQGDCTEILKSLPEKSIQCVVTSPPYYGLRDYGVDGQIGLESTPDEYVSKLVHVFREVKRVLKDDGTLWINLGDSYASQAGGQVEQSVRGNGNRVNAGQNGSNGVGTSRKPPEGMKPKDLIGIPWMVAFALRADGWYLRSDIIWAKNNPMPESVKDRPTKSHEYLFLLSKSQKYYYNAEAIYEEASPVSVNRIKYGWDCDRVNISPDGNGSVHTNQMGDRWVAKKRGFKDKEQIEDNQHHGQDIDTGAYRNKRSVWTINTQPFKGAHFAVMPEKLVEPCILAGSKEGDWILDPFNGSGTVGAVSVRNGRSYIGIDLNNEYIEMARERIFAAQQQMRLPI